MKTLSIIIPAYNHLPTVMRCIAAVRRTVDPAATELLVQDDASPEYDGHELLGAMCERNPENLGFAGNCNRGAQRARGDVLVFLNQDVFPTTPGWDHRLLDFFAHTPNAGVAGPTLLFPDGRVQSVGGGFDARMQPYHLHLGATNPDWKPINTPREVAWITGAVFAVRRDVWQKLGGFDEGYVRGYFEDVDFCMRAKAAGYTVHHRPNVRMTHAVGSTGGSPHFMQNARRFYERWVLQGHVQPDTQFVMINPAWW